MKKAKAAGPSGVVAEIMLKAAGETGIEMISNLTNQIVREGVIPADWDLQRLEVDGSGPKTRLRE